VQIGNFGFWAGKSMNFSGEFADPELIHHKFKI